MNGRRRDSLPGNLVVQMRSKNTQTHTHALTLAHTDTWKQWQREEHDVIVIRYYILLHYTLAAAGRCFYMVGFSIYIFTLSHDAVNLLVYVLPLLLLLAAAAAIIGIVCSVFFPCNFSFLIFSLFSALKYRTFFCCSYWNAKRHSHAHTNNLPLLANRSLAISMRCVAGSWFTGTRASSVYKLREAQLRTEFPGNSKRAKLNPLISFGVNSHTHAHAILSRNSFRNRSTENQLVFIRQLIWEKHSKLIVVVVVVVNVGVVAQTDGNRYWAEILGISLSLVTHFICG